MQKYKTRGISKVKPGGGGYSPNMVNGGGGGAAEMGT